MQKRIVLLTLLGLLCLSLAGCGAAALPDPAASPAPTAEPTPSPTPEPTKPPYLSFPDGSRHDYGETTLDLSWLEHEQAAETAELLREMPQLREVELGMDRTLSAEAALPEGEELPEPEEGEEPAVEPERLTWADIRLLQEAAARWTMRAPRCGRSCPA